VVRGNKFAISQAAFTPQEGKFEWQELSFFEERRMNRWISGSTIAAFVISLIAAGCAPAQPTEDEQPAEEPIFEEEEEEHDHEHEEDRGVLGLVGTAVMLTGEGDELGVVTFTQTDEGVLVEGQLENLEPGPKGFHVHEHGECDPPDFESAGGHFNPEGHPHGGPDADRDERHAGDFGNIEFDDEGVAEFSFVDEVITLGDGTNDVAGKALIVHYDEDDEETPPTGDAGARAGCGIIEVVRSDIE
jgi:superoxide dismutase, Cu-Zn family